MSWGISYKYNGYLIRAGLSNLEEEIDERKKMNDFLWQKIIALCASSPYDMKDDEGNSIAWADYIVGQVREIRQEIEENEYFLNHAGDVIEAKNEDPSSVSDS